MMFGTSTTGSRLRRPVANNRNDHNNNDTYRNGRDTVRHHGYAEEDSKETMKGHALLRSRRRNSLFAMFTCLGILYLISLDPFTLFSPKKPTLDFVTAGIMKSGTSTLLYAFADHEDVDHAAYEMCGVSLPGILGSWLLQKNVRTMKSVLDTSSRPKKRGLKCPLIAFDESSIQRVVAHSPQVKFLLTIRHPVLTVESLYNYYVIWAYKSGRERYVYSVATFDRLVAFDPALTYGAKSWRGLLSIAKFENHLANFKKTVLKTTKTQQQQQTDPRVYIMSIEQMRDSNETRNNQFRQDLQDFLGLQKPIRSLATPENKNTFYGDRAFAEIIDICESKFDEVRRKLMNDVKPTIEWIEHEFLSDPGVRLANRDHFIEILHGWTKDPCEERKERISCQTSNCHKTYD